MVQEQIVIAGKESTKDALRRNPIGVTGRDGRPLNIARRELYNVSNRLAGAAFALELMEEPCDEVKQLQLDVVKLLEEAGKNIPAKDSEVAWARTEAARIL